MLSLKIKADDDPRGQPTPCKYNCSFLAYHVQAEVMVPVLNYTAKTSLGSTSLEADQRAPSLTSK